MSHITYKVRVHDDGDKEWLLNGKLHREDGPAIEYSNGTKKWFLNDERHREDGPAIDCYDGTKHWYLNNVEYSEEEFNKKMSPAIEMTVAEVGKALGREVKIIG